MLSNITPAGFACAIISNNVALLKKIPGIGPKTAQRIILELKDKLNELLNKAKEIDLNEVREDFMKKVNELKEITNPAFFIRNSVPTPDL